MFQDNSEKIQKDIENAIKAEDGEKLFHLAHTLKGTLGNFSAKTGQYLAEDLEDISREKGFQKAAKVANLLKQEVAKINNELQNIIADHAVV